jgi:predicted RNA-binding Zn ribbon-like protein
MLNGMVSLPQSRSLAPELPLKFIGGDPSLDFVNTVDWTPDGLVHDRLVDYRRLIEWGEGAGLLDPGTRARLLKHARARPRAARAAYEHARWARWVLQRLFASVASRAPSATALRDFNRLARQAAQHLTLAYTGREAGRLAWEADRPDDLEIVIWAVTRAAAALLEFDAPRLRICGGPDCGWIYADRSRNGLRRWCEMQTCGTLEKSRRRAARQRRTAPGAPREMQQS